MKKIKVIMILVLTILSLGQCTSGVDFNGGQQEQDEENKKNLLRFAAVTTLFTAAPKATTGTTTTSTASACTNCKMFMTASTYNGSLGGITGADAKCTSDANKPATGTYKAFIVDGTTRRACTTANCGGGASEGIDWVLKANTSYTRVDGTAIGTTNAARIFTAPLTNPVNPGGVYTEYRTGFAIGGTPDFISHATATCGNYTLTTGAGVCGNASSSIIATGGGSMNNFLYSNGSGCSVLTNLICVEQ